MHSTVDIQHSIFITLCATNQEHKHVKMSQIISHMFVRSFDSNFAISLFIKMSASCKIILIMIFNTKQIFFQYTKGLICNEL